MADGRAGYTGVVYSEYEAGYTSAEGYTGVVRGTMASGYTGAAFVPSAPVTTKGGSAAGPILVTTGGRSEVDPIPVTPSPYDGVAADRGTAPGAALPLDYRSAPPSVDSGISREEEEAEPPPPPPQDPAAGQLAPIEAPYSEGDDARVGKIDELVRSLLSVGRQIRLSPVPEPNESLARAQRLLEKGLAPVPLGSRIVEGEPDLLQELWPRMPEPKAFGRDLVGRLADFLDQKVAETLAQSKPNNLGVAYLQGILQEVLSTMIQATRSTTEQNIDPVGTTLDLAKGLVEAIRGRMDKEGESFWEAVDSVLNPVTKLVRAGEQANEIAGEALAADRRGRGIMLCVLLARQAAARLKLASLLPTSTA
jgi:hypothetical protein